MIPGSPCSELEARVHHLEALDRISRVAAGSGSVPELLRGLMAEVRSLFQADRTWLLHPCNPEALEWKLITQAHGPGFGVDEDFMLPIPMDPSAAQVAREALEAGEPVSYGPARPHPWREAALYQVQSQLHVVVDPGLGDPWLLGIHQCCEPRHWTPQEHRLLADIALRVAPVLRLLLVQQDLEVGRAKHRAITERAGDAILVTDGQGRIQEANAQAETLLERPLQDLLGRSLLDLHPLEAQARARRLFTEILDGRPIHSEPVPFLLPDGARIEVEVSAQAAPDQDMVIGILRDCTERNRAIRELAASEARRSAILRTIPDLVFVNDADGTYLDYHSPSPDLLLFPPEVFLGRRMDEFLAPELADAFRTRMQAALTSGELQVFEYTLDIPAGRRFFEARISPSEGATTVTIIRDITERHAQAHMAEEVQKAQKLESLGVLAGGIAHDFNNILAGILGYLSLMEEDTTLSPEVLDMLQRCKKAGHQAKDLTRQLLTFSRGGSPLKEPSSLAHLVEEATRFCLRGSACRADLDLPTDLLPVFVDPNQISQVLQNILINAVQAMPQGGTLHVRARNRECLAPPSAGLSPGTYLELTLRDEGVGIDEAHLERIFDPFYTTKAGGNGLGLAIVYSILQKHAGCITASSRLGEGTTFQILLPAAQHLSMPEALPVTPGGFAAQGRVLVLDDEAEVREMAATMLRRCGFTVETAADGSQAIAAWEIARAAGTPFCLGLFDFTIPGGMGGPEAARQILVTDPEALLVLSSGYAASGVESAPGFRARLPKPYTYGELCTALREVLGEARV